MCKVTSEKHCVPESWKSYRVWRWNGDGGGGSVRRGGGGWDWRQQLLCLHSKPVSKPGEITSVNTNRLAGSLAMAQRSPTNINLCYLLRCEGSWNRGKLLKWVPGLLMKQGCLWGQSTGFSISFSAQGGCTVLISEACWLVHWPFHINTYYVLHSVSFSHCCY